MSRQLESITRIRATRRKAGLCFECGVKSKTYRCAACNAVRRDSERAWRKVYMLNYMGERRKTTRGEK